MKKYEFDVNYCFLNDKPENVLILKYDPDKSSKTLQYFHQKLWSKEENGIKFDFISETDEYDKNQLVLINKFNTCQIIFSEDQKVFSSDWIINNYQHWNKETFPDLKYLDNINVNIKNSFNNIANTIGGRIIFPRRKINGKNTINIDRGIHSNICDRFDITLECIRRFYNKEENHFKFDEIGDFGNTLNRYEWFFNLFGKCIDGFKNYCDFFFLQDLTINDYTEIKFFFKPVEFVNKPFSFYNNPYPKCEREYLEFIENATKFIEKRCIRMQNYINNILNQIKTEEKEAFKFGDNPQYATADELMEKEIIPWLNSLDLQ